MNEKVLAQADCMRYDQSAINIGHILTWSSDGATIQSGSSNVKPALATLRGAQGSSVRSRRATRCGEFSWRFIRQK
jgi:hypothetical protein